VSHRERNHRRGSRVVTETRVAAVDQRALLAFRAYWLIVRPVLALIRRRHDRATSGRQTGEPCAAVVLGWLIKRVDMGESWISSR
jgi:hypothetical protein